MVKVKTAARREAILAAAKQVFQEVGFDRASMDEVAARFGGAKATVYRYFGSKEALFKELISQTANEMGGGMDLLFKSMGIEAQEGQLPDHAMPCKFSRCLIPAATLNPLCECWATRH